MKLIAIIAAGVLAVPVAGWSDNDTLREDSREFGNRLEESAHKAGNSMEKGLERVGESLEPLGNSLKKGARSIERGFERTGESIDRNFEVIDKEEDGMNVAD